MNIKMSLLEVGGCLHPEKIILPGTSWRPRYYPATVALIEHDLFGPMLFDTGYAEHFFTCTKSFPEKLYALLTPVRLPYEKTLIYQLKLKNISPRDIQRIFISHFHADHIAGLKDFPNANLYYMKKGFDYLTHLSRLSQIRAGFLKELIPSDISERSIYLENLSTVKCTQGEETYEVWDLLEDSSVLAIELPGHARGQFGLIVRTSDQGNFLLAADACWDYRACKQNISPSWITRIIHDDFKTYKNTLSALHQFCNKQSDLKIIPCHCHETYQEVKGHEQLKV